MEIWKPPVELSIASGRKSCFSTALACVCRQSGSTKGASRPRGSSLHELRR